jgi:hypothetical protein
VGGGGGPVTALEDRCVLPLSRTLPQNVFGRFNFWRGQFGENPGPGSAIKVGMSDDWHRRVMTISIVVAIIVVVVVAGVWIIR